MFHLSICLSAGNRDDPEASSHRSSTSSGTSSILWQAAPAASGRQCVLDRDGTEADAHKEGEADPLTSSSNRGAFPFSYINPTRGTPQETQFSTLAVGRRFSTSRKVAPLSPLVRHPGRRNSGLIEGPHAWILAEGLRLRSSDGNERRDQILHQVPPLQTLVRYN